MRVLLDTCTLLWLVNKDRSLTSVAKETIQSSEFVYASSVTALELSLKYAKGKLDLRESIETWFERAVGHHGLTDLPLDRTSAIRSTTLPHLHADPADRLLIATALENNLTL